MHARSLARTHSDDDGIGDDDYDGDDDDDDLMLVPLLPRCMFCSRLCCAIGPS